MYKVATAAIPGMYKAYSAWKKFPYVTSVAHLRELLKQNSDRWHIWAVADVYYNRSAVALITFHSETFANETLHSY